jgi:two-component system chemotaxis response regulator CheY
MNGESSSFTIGVIGFERAECHLLRRVVSLSEHRQPTFGPFNKERGGYPHVVVVNADQHGAIEKWNGFRRAHAHRASFAPIFVSRQPTELPCPGPYVLHRPILTTQLFSVLDQVVTEVHGYRPASTVETGRSLVAFTETPAVARDAMTTIQNERVPRRIQIAPRTSSNAAEGGAALMVDDGLSPRARLQMRDTLSSIAFRVDFAESAGQALRLIDIYTYSVILLDALLPDADVYDVCTRIKKHPLQQRASTVMVSGNASPAERVMGLLAGFDHFLAKPIRPEGISELAAEFKRPAAAI